MKFKKFLRIRYQHFLQILQSSIPSLSPLPSGSFGSSRFDFDQSSLSLPLSSDCDIGHAVSSDNSTPVLESSDSHIHSHYKQRMVNSDVFKKFILVIRPAYTKHIPHRQKLVTDLLKEVYNNETSETADELQTVVSEAKTLASEMYNTNVYVIISDNVANKISMGKKIDEWHTTCHSHPGNLLLKDIVNKDVNEKIISLIKLFKWPEFEQKILTVGGKKLRLLGDTRWCSYRDAYGLFFSNLTIIKHFAVDNEESSPHKITEEQRKTLFDEDFISTIRENVQIMNPVRKILNFAQKYGTTVAQSIEEWLKLESKLS
ncbi:hypothetical protein PGB90_005259 [Kerria lacca]